MNVFTLEDLRAMRRRLREALEDLGNTVSAAEYRRIRRIIVRLDERIVWIESAGRQAS